MLEEHGDVNDPKFLRNMLSKNSFLLAYERLTNQRIVEDIKKLIANQKVQSK